MNTPFYIAKRYLFSKKSLNAINFISGISVLGVFVGSAALIIILSVFNGFENLVLSMYNTFTPEIRIEPSKGKTFDPASAHFNALRRDRSIANFTEVLEEKALLRYGKAQYIGFVKGVSASFTNNENLDSSLVEGSFTLKNEDENYAVIGSAVQAYLSININNDFQNLEIYSPQKGAVNSINPAEEFVLRTIHPVGVYQVQQQFDEFVIVPLEFARELLGEEKNVSAIEITLKQGESVDEAQKKISLLLGPEFMVKNRIQQNQLLYKTLSWEKFATYMILTFVLIIAIFNIIGSLTMLVMDKLKDIALLSSMGASSGLIRSIFFLEGIMISLIGCIGGMLTGLIFCLFQQKYALIKMDMPNLTTDAYPIHLQWGDFVVVFLTVSIISAIASFISSNLSVKNIGSIIGDL